MINPNEAGFIGSIEAILRSIKQIIFDAPAVI